MNRKLFCCAVCVLVLAAGCANDTQRGAATGAVIGGVLGAVIGHQSGEDEEGAILGAIAGAVVGAVIADQMSSRQAEVEETMTQQDRAVRDELQATLMPDKSRFSSSEPIVLEIAVDNASSDKVYLSSPAFYADGDLGLMIETDDGPLAEPDGSICEFLSTSGRGSGVQTLRPGRGFSRQIVINPGSGGCLSDDVVYRIPQISRPGRYTVKAVAYHRYSAELPSSADALDSGEGKEITLSTNLAAFSVAGM